MPICSPPDRLDTTTGAARLGSRAGAGPAAWYFTHGFRGFVARYACSAAVRETRFAGAAALAGGPSLSGQPGLARLWNQRHLSSAEVAGVAFEASA